MNLDMHDRIMRILDATHIVRIEDSAIYKVSDVIPLGDNLLFVETEGGLCFQDMDVMTLSEATNMEKQMSIIKEDLAKGI